MKILELHKGSETIQPMNKAVSDTLKQHKNNNKTSFTTSFTNRNYNSIALSPYSDIFLDRESK